MNQKARRRESRRSVTFDVLSEISLCFDGDDSVSGAVHDQGRLCDGWQPCTHVEIENHLEVRPGGRGAHGHSLDAGLSAALFLPTWSRHRPKKVDPFRITPMVGDVVQVSIACFDCETEAVAAI